MINHFYTWYCYLVEHTTSIYTLKDFDNNFKIKISTMMVDWIMPSIPSPKCPQSNHQNLCISHHTGKKELCSCDGGSWVGRLAWIFSHAPNDVITQVLRIWRQEGQMHRWWNDKVGFRKERKRIKDAVFLALKTKEGLSQRIRWFLESGKDKATDSSPESLRGTNPGNIMSSNQRRWTLDFFFFGTVDTQYYIRFRCTT